MSLDAMQRITQAEADGKTQKIEAAAQAKALLAQGEADGQAKLAKAIEEAKAQVSQLMLQGEARAKQRAQAAMAEAEAACQTLRNEAMNHMGQASTLIVRRVVNG